MVDRSMSPSEAALAEERGRLMAAGVLMNNLEKRKQVEDTFGKAYCVRRYPEVYKTSEN